MTQQQLADIVGIRFQQIQKYETGANRISASRLWDLAQALKVQVSAFYAGLDGFGAAEDGPMQAKETFDLVRAYYGVGEVPRRRLLALAKAMGGAEEADERVVSDAPVLAE
jgi:transcriptional regulator with XRE-family HTH domain